MHPLNMNPHGVLHPLNQHIAITSLWLPGASAAVTTGVLTKQIGPHAYIAQDTALSTSGHVSLVGTAAATAAGQASVAVTTFSGGTEHLQYITSEHLHTFEGNTYKWTETGALPDATYATIAFV